MCPGLTARSFYRTVDASQAGFIEAWIIMEKMKRFEQLVLEFFIKVGVIVFHYI